MVLSPGGSTYPYYYKNGELHCLKYGGFGSHSTVLLSLMEQERDFILSKPVALNIWIDCYKTSFNQPVLAGLTAHLLQLQGHVTRIALVGMPWWPKFKLTFRLKKLGYPVRFFEDPEAAKTWVVKG